MRRGWEKVGSDSWPGRTDISRNVRPGPRTSSLAGPIKRHGRFSARYSQGGTVFKVKGHVSGSIATITGSEHGSFEKNGETVTCHGSQKFKAHGSPVTGGQ